MSITRKKLNIKKKDAVTRLYWNQKGGGDARQLGEKPNGAKNGRLAQMP